ncbi:Nudix family hydrolase [Acidithiobacillus sp. AMEEHan]|uniref:Nudix family hydrolase n=1 Tax=Acidithiobacillus sp. AMEEHan TaxID=2994951 RepID=UPI0027E5B946|nr:Nudix family hydrolase [Acidithiobacillus sp. AMEEHan]
MAVVPVATGVLQRADGKVLISLRPEGKPWPGFWEFPGGKIEPGEAPEAALARELAEEIGVRVQVAEPLLRRDHPYPERTVALHFYLLRRWEGEPYGREGQQIRWVHPWEIAALDCLAPNLPVVAKLLNDLLPQPPLWLIADPARVATERFLPALGAAIDAGLRALVLRCKTPIAAELAQRLPAFLGELQDAGVQVYLNHPDPLPNWPVAGRHLTEAQLAHGLRPEQAFGVSCHSPACLQQAARLGARYAFLSPLFATATHPGAEALGPERFAEWVAPAALPVIALGGMTPERVALARQAGAQGVAVLSGILEAADPAQATRAYLAAWSENA